MKHLVTVSEKYSFLIPWYYQFKLKYWADSNTEDVILSEAILGRDHIKVDKSIGWGSQMIQYLNQIDDEYIMLSFEDHFIVNTFDNDTFLKIEKLLEEDNTIEKVCLVKQPDRFKGTLIGDDLYWTNNKKPNEPSYTLLPSIWKRSTLLSFLNTKIVNPHQFERNNRDKTIKVIVSGHFIYPNLDVFRKSAFDITNLGAFKQGKKSWGHSSLNLNKEDKEVFEQIYEQWKN